jgi:CBS domain containing-hemolysin-like protein
MHANKFLRKLIQEKKSIAAVVDEFGGISGMVTIEDIIEEIFGEIVDEHDTIELTEKQISDREFIFSGRLEIDYINEKYRLKIKESDEYDTLAGFIFHHYENIPKMNESFTIGNFKFKVLKVTKTRLEIVHMTIIDGD